MRYKPRAAGVVVDDVCREFGVTGRKLLHNPYDRSVSHARYAASLALRLIPNITGLQRSYPQIGRVLSRHHATVIYSERRALKLAAENPEFAMAMARVLGEQIAIDTVKEATIPMWEEQTHGTDT